VREQLVRGLRACVWFAAGCIALAPDTAPAGGFQVSAGSPDWAANAFAGMAAKGYDASTAWTNPAAMTRLSGSELEGGLNAIMPDIEFTGENRVGPFTTPGSTGGNAAIAGVTASFAGVWSASPDLKFGVSLEDPFGQRLNYPFNWVGRYQSLVSSATDIELGLVAAYRIDRHLSIGGGPIIDYFQTRLTSAIDIDPTSGPTNDPIADIHGHDWSAGYHLGALYETDWPLRFGVDYRSRITEPVGGSQSVSVPPLLPPSIAGPLAAANTDVQTDVTLPDVLTLSAVWDVDAQWSALATVQWTDWSLLQQLSIVGANGQTTTLPLLLHSSWLGALGANYRPVWAPGLMLQAGLAFDESAATDATRSPELPGRDTIKLGLGFSYAILPNAQLQFAFLRDFGIGPNAINYSANPMAGVLSGSYTTNDNLVSLGATWRF
jgi:long-chain fatty acid transport protein